MTRDYDYAKACRLATHDQGLDAFAAADGWTVEQTGGFTMVAVRYMADGNCWTVTDDGGDESAPYLAVLQPSAVWREGTDGDGYDGDGAIETRQGLTEAEALALGSQRRPARRAETDGAEVTVTIEATEPGRLLEEPCDEGVWLAATGMRTGQFPLIAVRGPRSDVRSFIADRWGEESARAALSDS